MRPVSRRRRPEAGRQAYARGSSVLLLVLVRFGGGAQPPGGTPGGAGSLGVGVAVPGVGIAGLCALRGHVVGRRGGARGTLRCAEWELFGHRSITCCLGGGFGLVAAASTAPPATQAARGGTGGAGGTHPGARSIGVVLFGAGTFPGVGVLALARGGVRVFARLLGALGRLGVLTGFFGRLLAVFARLLGPLPVFGVGIITSTSGGAVHPRSEEH